MIERKGPMNRDIRTAKNKVKPFKHHVVTLASIDDQDNDYLI